MKGLLVSVYRQIKNGKVVDCTNNGITSKYDTFVLITNGEYDPFEPDENKPPLFIIKCNIYGKEYVHAQPTPDGQYMFGGNFIYSGDSRVSKICPYPIPVHDRKE